MTSPAHKRAKYDERVDSISILQAECRARGGTAVWVYFTIGKEKRVRVTADLKLRIMRERVAREALANVRKEPLLPSTVPLYLSPPATDQSSRVCGPVYSGIPHGGPLAALQPVYGWPSILGKRRRGEEGEDPVYMAGTNLRHAIMNSDDKYELTDAEKSNIKASL
ncbi:hypothetical protein BOTNAR_0439g00100 [Botryotinia narcissicola]|uniref:Uncharacterized protein n=1 Tax=Botryotinia narcissicola TaxID=278944 RepID=A0A4Z1HWS6_9HELO|nr:hypothetical protein BOTNAR_0439g00100 [Botryotinia narcissicola]